MKHPGAHSLLHRVLQIERHNTLFFHWFRQEQKWLSDQTKGLGKENGRELILRSCSVPGVGCRLGVLRCATGAARGWL